MADVNSKVKKEHLFLNKVQIVDVKIKQILSEKEIQELVNGQFPAKSCLVKEWKEVSAGEGLLGHLGEHLKVVIDVVVDDEARQLVFFVKCLPRNNRAKSDYLMEHNIFPKEYAMYNGLFKVFGGSSESSKWRPRLHYCRRDALVFEDLTVLGYEMPDQRQRRTLEELETIMRTLARFHACSIVFEEKNSKTLGRPYSVWEDHKQDLSEISITCVKWREVGIKLVIDFLIKFHKHKSRKDFAKELNEKIPKCFDEGFKLNINPSKIYRNVICHRDLWANNLFLLYNETRKPVNAVFVDFQTVIYAPPSADLASVLYMNSDSSFREKYTYQLMDTYYEELQNNLDFESIDLKMILTREDLDKSYEEYRIFGLTQAAFVLPYANMDKIRSYDIFYKDPSMFDYLSNVNRSDVMIAEAETDNFYRETILEVLDEIVEKYIL